MFERFDDAARRVVVVSQEEARRLHHRHIGSEHLLLGVLGAAEDGTAPATVQLLLHEGLSPADAAQRLRPEPGAGEPSPNHLPFTEEAKAALEAAFRQSITVGDEAITPDHLLLGIGRTAIATPDSIAAQSLSTLGLTNEMLRIGFGRYRAAMSRVLMQAIQRAGWWARRRDTEIRTEHLLLGLLDTDEQLCERVFAAAGADPQRIRAELLALVEPATE
ncbi:Clp protease N-terminal domain-containing protein [Nocardia sp. alder85J]|uniref:Clp protease N-terminal domain-containing protein n=1 Tax=Nocardia sp. alder85J TaxID=2862949 RepID=UPI001CD3A35D|nr:Clp protease N-terminal domain-containing protein [Nocardia sp. alder85J]MCX4097623.1 hypothetical protein [Nocardia sp. alder85J]